LQKDVIALVEGYEVQYATILILHNACVFLVLTIELVECNLLVYGYSGFNFLTIYEIFITFCRRFLLVVGRPTVS